MSVSNRPSPQKLPLPVNGFSQKLAPAEMADKARQNCAKTFPVMGVADCLLSEIARIGFG